MNENYHQYPFIKQYSESVSIPEPTLAEAFEVEKRYHQLLLKELDFEKRQLLYRDLYSEVIPIYGRHENLEPQENPKDKHVELFSMELSQKSIVDFGCGQGYMLQSIASRLNVKNLLGVDVYVPEGLKAHDKIEFVESNIVNYVTPRPYEVAISDNVLEHLVPEDANIHLKSIYKSLTEGGKLILIMPNRLFGPTDITRIKDFSHSGRISAEGGHVNESTYSEMLKILRSIGFRNFSTVVPIPKLKYKLLKGSRLGTSWITRIENSDVLLKLFRAIKIGGVCPIRFTITLIAHK